MSTLLLNLLRVLPALCGGHRQLCPENLALRHQLTVYKRTVARPRLRGQIASFGSGWPGSGLDEAAARYRDPDTVLRWQRRRFRDHWIKLSGRPTAGPPPVNAEIKSLVLEMSAANPLWGACPSPKVGRWAMARPGRPHHLRGRPTGPQQADDNAAVVRALAAEQPAEVRGRAR
jgi:hypothetical protein